MGRWEVTWASWKQHGAWGSLWLCRVKGRHEWAGGCAARRRSQDTWSQTGGGDRDAPAQRHLALDTAGKGRPRVAPGGGRRRPGQAEPDATGRARHARTGRAGGRGRAPLPGRGGRGQGPVVVQPDQTRRRATRSRRQVGSARGPSLRPLRSPSPTSPTAPLLPSPSPAQAPPRPVFPTALTQRSGRWEVELPRPVPNPVPPRAKRAQTPSSRAPETRPPLKGLLQTVGFHPSPGH